MVTRRERLVESSGIRLHVVEEGDENARPVLFLHGFPEFWWSWRHQLRAVADAGFRGVAMDLRGFGGSDKPDEVSDYALPSSLGDVSAVVDSLGGRVALVGHDWGGVLAWLFTTFRADAVERLAVLNAPHPAAFRTLRDSLPQLQASWYMFLFQLEGTAEEVLSRNGMELMRRWFYDTARVRLADEDVRRYLEAFSEPGALTAGLRWYRANPPPVLWAAPPPELPPVSRPTLLLWGVDDPYLTFELARRSGAYVDAPFALQALTDTGHWTQQERPDEVNAHLTSFLRANLE